MYNDTISLPIYLDDPSHYVYRSGQKKCPKAFSYYRALGIKLYGLKDLTDDSLFVNAKLPNGWTARADNVYWASVYDRNDKERFSYFVKVTWYEKVAFTRKQTRYYYRLNYDLLNDNAYENTIIQYLVKDGDDVIYKTDPVMVYNDLEGVDEDSDAACLMWRKIFKKVDIIKNRQIKECRKFLNENFPKWKSYTSYL